MRTAPRPVLAAILIAALLAGGARGQQAPGPNPGERLAILTTLGDAHRHALGAPAGMEDAAEEEVVRQILSYARTQHQGQVAPGAVSAQWHDVVMPYDPEPAFRAALAEGALREWLAALPPPDPRYAALVQAHERYLEMSGRGWAPAPDGPALRAGESGPAVAALRARLTDEGFRCANGATEAIDAPPEIFDPALECAVRAFQELRGLEIDGVVGPQTRAALNVPAAARARQIEANMERWRWLPREWPADRIEVNTGAPEAALYLEGALMLRTRVIAGKPSTPTPTFATAVRGVVINPSWNVPESIARNELLPREAREPGYLARNHYTREGGRLVQTPGEHNALGRIKLDMPNPYTVYLHDTPARTLFANARRYLSHGCMRMQQPREMAALLLRARGWTAEDIDAAIDAGATQTVALAQPVPVFVYHHTAWVRDDGALVLAPDVYGWDAALLAAIDGAQARPDAAVSIADTDCALSDAGGVGAG